MKQSDVKLFWNFFESFHRGRLMFESFYKKIHSSFAKRKKSVVAFYKKADFSPLEEVHRNYFSNALRNIKGLSKYRSEFGGLLSIERPLTILYHRVSITMEHYKGIVEGGKSKQELIQESDRLIERYLEEINRLLRRCSRQVEAVARRLRNESLFLRSIYLHGDVVLGGPNGKRDMLRKLFDRGIAEAYLTIAEDFYRSGFYIRARDTLERLNKTLHHHRIKDSRDENIKKKAEELTRRVDNAIEHSLGEEQ